MRHPSVPIAAVAALAVLVGGCGTERQLVDELEATGTHTVGNVPTDADPGEEFGEDVAEFTAIVEAEDHQSDGQVVRIEQASIDPAPGWVLIFTSEDGSPAAVIGRHQLEAAFQDFDVTLDEPLPPGEHRLWAQIHIDAEPTGDLQWPGRDEPVVGENGDVIQTSFTVTVTE